MAKQIQAADLRAILKKCQDLVHQHDPRAYVVAHVTAGEPRGLSWFIHCTTRALAKAPLKEERIGGIASDPKAAGKLFEKSLAFVLKRNAEVAARRRPKK